MSSRQRRPSPIRPEQALKLFRIRPTATLRELNGAYRRLVKKHHPDYNRDRTDWAHNAMTKINAAYDIALDYLASLRYQEVEARLERHIRVHDAFSEVFDRIADAIIEGLFVYYQYGLENHHLRTEGVRRFRYKLALRRVQTGLDQLRRLTPPNPIDDTTLSVFTDFTAAFFQCMRIGRQASAGSDSEEQKAYQHYRAGSRHLDITIKRTFFRNELSKAGDFATPHGLSVSHDEFMAVITRYNKSSWVAETALKIYLTDAFERLIKISERIPGLRQG